MASRLLLASSSIALFFGGAVHTRSFGKAATAISASALAPFFAKAFKALWLIDSTMLFMSAIIFALAAFRPALASRSVLTLIALMLAVIATLLYYFVGIIMPAHLLAVASLLGFGGAALGLVSGDSALSR